MYEALSAEKIVQSKVSLSQAEVIPATVLKEALKRRTGGIIYWSWDIVCLLYEGKKQIERYCVFKVGLIKSRASAAGMAALSYLKHQACAS